MPSEPRPEVLDRHLSKAEAAELIALCCPLLRELVNHGTDALIRCARAADPGRMGGENVDLAVFVLYRQMLETVDGIEVLFSESCVDAAVPLLRSAFEVSMALSYILQSDDDYRLRSLAWTCAQTHRIIETHRQYDPSATQDPQRLQMLSAFNLDYDSSASAAALERVLQRPEFAEVNSEYVRRKQAGSRTPEWFSLVPNGPADRRILARRVELEEMYLVFYGDWSAVSHAATATPWLRAGDRPGVSAFLALRTARGMNDWARVLAILMLRSTRLMIQHFRPGENLTSWYMREVQRAFMRLVGTQVEIRERTALEGHEG